MNQEILLQKGRIVYINFGKESQKYAVMSDFVNTKKVIIDSPINQIKRQVISIKRIEPTKYNIKDFDNSKNIQTFSERFNKAVALLQQNGKGKQLRNQELRRNLSDFDRFKVLVLKRKLSKAIRTNLKKN